MPEGNQPALLLIPAGKSFGRGITGLGFAAARQREAAAPGAEATGLGLGVENAEAGPSGDVFSSYRHMRSKVRHGSCCGVKRPAWRCGAVQALVGSPARPPLHAPRGLVSPCNFLLCPRIPLQGYHTMIVSNTAKKFGR